MVIIVMTKEMLLSIGDDNIAITEKMNNRTPINFRIGR